MQSESVKSALFITMPLAVRITGSFVYRYTAVAVIEMDFERIDINQCPLGEGNKGPNRFADTARCKKDTTEVSAEKETGRRPARGLGV